MILNDRLYGQYNIDQVLVELIETKPIQRLKRIHQAGATVLVDHHFNGTRYDHSIGVMLLIKRLGGSIKEQIAGLLHDVSHTAFSHVIDFVFDNSEENYHETIFEKVILDSEIPSILEKYQIDIKEIFDIDKWEILEKELPKLCADRIDYTLRDMHTYFGIPKKEIELFLNSLVIVNGEICVNSIEMAEWFTVIYYKLAIDYFLGPISIYSYDSLSKIIKLALQKGISKLDDLLLDDMQLMTLIQESNDKEIQELINSLYAKVELEENEQDYDIHRKGKRRIIDVPVSLDGKTVQLSSLLSDNIAKMNKIAIEKSEKGTFVKIKR
ncbi:HD domain-containing protein [Gottfriedia acidiceleris]|uniref:HD domain-containing protein n=1 Tax=Gottfriedia acidiceleris TaxID=371036 RepID=A0ABY4JPN2_9BACI|nr:HD domain-containing protein [Gottfriedia acidiceleris]UPM55045.1 HD domain-containing protein [Gottfriedia acidiceleris]